ncbi:unnamed protein product [Rotaria socialis]|uniref:Uncharacterized protein n=1 Tax=Rotaria socialis TaxID=392032 RepID=A0A820XHD6_9BILA|nr:unnamed protein product [Rotaria socialis]
MQWVEQLPTNKYLNGTSNFRDVYYCPGNHELWTRSGREDEELHIDNSIEKFQKLMKAYIDEMSLRRQQWLDSRKGSPPIEEWNNDSEFFINGWN